MNKPPLPVLARGSLEDCKHPPGHLQPVIDPNRCEGKGLCLEVCPVQVFAMGTLALERRATLTLKGRVKGFVHRWQQANIVNAAACQGCGVCVQACPEQAITLARGGAADRSPPSA